MNNKNSRRAARSHSRNGAGRYHADEQINTFQLIRLINSTVEGRMNLGTVKSFLFKDFDSESKDKFPVIWNHLLQNKENFIVSDSLKDVRELTGHETVWVRTVLSLCKTHCRRESNGRNRVCTGDCGGLHVCRTFLLQSEKACPFNIKKNRCMFGHSFATTHNVELLKAHNLFGLSDEELHKLFRRRPSRTEITLPQVCIYYNKADGKKCTRENCKSLHICSDFIQHRCVGSCSRNHTLTTSQVQRVLELFAFDRSWNAEMLLQDLQHFMTARHRHETGSTNSGEDSDISDSSKEDDTVVEGAARLASLVSTNTSSPFSAFGSNSQMCGGCEQLKQDVDRMNQTILWLTTQVSDLTKLVEAQKSSKTNDTKSQAKKM